MAEATRMDQVKLQLAQAFAVYARRRKRYQRMTMVALSSYVAYSVMTGFASKPKKAAVSTVGNAEGTSTLAAPSEDAEHAKTSRKGKSRSRRGRKLFSTVMFETDLSSIPIRIHR